MCESVHVCKGEIIDTWVGELFLKIDVCMSDLVCLCAWLLAGV